MACRIDRARLWRGRILIESRLHDANCFVTLTYDEQHLPKDGSLVPRDYQLFLKRLRRRLAPRVIRFFAVGEYGDKSGRPHYHLCLFGLSMFEDDAIRACWDKGFVHVDELNAATAGYISGYVIKKWTNPNDPQTSELLQGRSAEFARMSLRPGIGAGCAPLISEAIAYKSCEIPGQLRMDGTLVPLGRYLKRKVREQFANEAEIHKYEKEVWLRSVHEEFLKDKEEAKEKGITIEKLRKERRIQRFLNAVAKHRVHKQRRSL